MLAQEALPAKTNYYAYIDTCSPIYKHGQRGGLYFPFLAFIYNCLINFLSFDLQRMEKVMTHDDSQQNAINKLNHFLKYYNKNFPLL